MRELCRRAVEIARARGASYADIRIIETKRQWIDVRNEIVSSLDHDEDLGFGVRVIVDGAWGFACSNCVTVDEIERVAELAVRVARSSAALKAKPVQLVDEPIYDATWTMPIDEDPFAIDLEEKIGTLLETNKIILSVPSIKVATSGMRFIREHQWFANTDGSIIEQTLHHTGAGLMATAVGHNEMQRRSYPASFGAQWMGRGYELVREIDLVGHAQQTAEEARALLTAPPCPTGRKDLILTGDQLALQIHESIGHATELDRILGTEASFAGTSFVRPEDVGSLRYGSENVTVVADGTLRHGLATVGYDDEGVASQCWPLIDHGVLVGCLTSRETAPAIGETRSRGTMRADGWARIPLIRMTNISLMPGEGTLEDLIADTDDGILVNTNRSWSIDQRRVNFQFGSEIAWEIKNGKKGRILKNPTYQGITTEFWGSCNFVCGPEEFYLWGVANCGKGEPGQRAEMSHGASPARFRNVLVGVSNG